jgi:hypothetical protein
MPFFFQKETSPHCCTAALLVPAVPASNRDHDTLQFALDNQYVDCRGEQD